MELYFLKSAACLAILLLFYKLVLEKEDMHVFNRFYLLLSVVISFLIPFITFTSYIEAPAEALAITSEVAHLPAPPPPSAVGIPIWQYVLWGIYAGGALVFGFRLITNIRKLVLRIQNNDKLNDGRITKVLLKEDIVPHTFLDFIFLNKRKFQENQIPTEVFEHEQAHASQKHSYDILFMELLQVLLWFHPLLYLAKNAMKLNHEFLADKSVLKKGTPTGEYQQILLAFSSNASYGSLAHPINYSVIKKRFTVMKTQTPKWAIWARSLLVLPVAAFLLYGFSTRQVVEQETSKHLQNESEVFQEKATPEMIEEYNKLAKYYNSLPENQTVIRMKDLERMRYIHSLMTEEQKKKAEPLPAIYPPPPPPLPEPQPKEVHAEIPEPPVPPAPASKINIPGPPPPPPAPEEHMKELAAQGARFIISGKGEISAEEAIKMVRNNKNVSIKVIDYNTLTTVIITEKNE